MRGDSETALQLDTMYEAGISWIQSRIGTRGTAPSGGPLVQERDYKHERVIAEAVDATQTESCFSFV
jgi:hypothetical protein